MEKNGSGFMVATLTEYDAEYIEDGRSSDDYYVAQCRGKVKYNINSLGKVSFQDCNSQAEVYYKKFGNEWQFESVSLKKSNCK